MRTIKIGAGAAWWGDRVEPARWNAERGGINYLCFETMAEATMTAAQVRRRRDPAFGGYDTYLDDRFDAVLGPCLKNGVKIISNQGWIDPEAACARVLEKLKAIGATGVKVAAVTGSVITDRLCELAGPITETGAAVETLLDKLICAEAYLGADGLVDALGQGADIVIAGRVADPSLFVAPMIHEFGWDPLDHARVGAGAGLGHLLECGAQVTGGYFADPGFKDVPEPWNLAFPIAEVSDDGSAVIGKIDGSGGAVSLMTVKEQMLYEVFDPANYITPDVIVDFTNVKLEQVGPNRVRVSGISGKPRPEKFKVVIGCLEGFIGEDMFFYAGPGALQRARLAEKILTERFKVVDLKAEEIRIDFLGYNALHGAATPADAPEPYEVGVRVAARTAERSEAHKVGREVDGMAVSGVGMTGKRVPHQDRVREIVGLWSSLAPREKITHRVQVWES